MPFRFSHICDLLERLEKIELRDPPLIRVQKQALTKSVIEQWFKQHRKEFDAPDANGVAILSTLFPERRPDRVYGIQAGHLTGIAARCLRLNSNKTKQLSTWRSPGNGDLGASLERILRDTDGPVRLGTVTIDQLDSALQQLASKCRFSGPKIRDRVEERRPIDILGNIFLKLYSWEVKWLVRLILKDYSPLALDQRLILKEFHFLLPGLLQIHDNFSAVISLLNGPLKRYHAKPDPLSQKLFRLEAAACTLPVIGVKTGRPTFIKARSFKNCLDLVAKHTWAVEQKYDGEYCEIHIDLRKGHDCIQIFSKSGKDSTQDRIGIHSTIRECLRIGQHGCGIRQKCILLGELVVYSDKDDKILEFHKIRKHVTRSGMHLGTMQDSPVQESEHLMLVFFDILLIDDENISTRPHRERRARLSQIIHKKRGRAITARRFYLDFSEDISKEHLLKQFAASLLERHEGLILKPSEAPYFSFHALDIQSQPNFYIKFKKDYMEDMGGSRDIADLAVIGASYDPHQAQKCHIRLLKWTDFFLGCLKNRDAVLHRDEKPIFTVVGVIKQEKCIPLPVLQTLNELGQFRSCKLAPNHEQNAFKIDFSYTNHRHMEVIFSEPFVVEVLGSGYDKQSNSNFYMLRHPRLLKVHLDRSWKEAVCWAELGELSQGAHQRPVEAEDHETAKKVAHFIELAEEIRCKISSKHKAIKMSTEQIIKENKYPEKSSAGYTRSTISLSLVECDLEKASTLSKRKRLRPSPLKVLPQPLTKSPASKEYNFGSFNSNDGGLGHSSKRQRLGIS